MDLSVGVQGETRLNLPLVHDAIIDLQRENTLTPQKHNYLL